VADQYRLTRATGRASTCFDLRSLPAQRTGCFDR
jgi:hypothetical protein